MRLRGEDGRSPDPPDPAYQQILHGVPAADLSPDELLYLPRNPRARGERSILEVLDAVEKLIAEGEAVIAIVDDRRARAAIVALDEVDVDLMATETYLEWLVRRFHVKEAETAWMTIRIAASEKLARAPDEDPVHIHKIR